jgi:hypothetical protein
MIFRRAVVQLRTSARQLLSLLARSAWAVAAQVVTLGRNRRAIMGLNRLVFCSVKVEPNDLRTYVEHRGGEWQELSTEGQGYLASNEGHAHLWVSLYPMWAFSEEFEEDRATLEAQIGATVQSVVDIRYGYGESTSPLAEQVAREISERWAGIPAAEIA